MERELDERSAYRARLLESLRSHKDREREEEPDLLQIFANEETVGTFDCDAPDSRLVVVIGKPVRILEVRTASGLLVAGFCPPDLGAKRTDCRVGRFLIKLDVDNDENRSTIRVGCRLVQPARVYAGQASAFLSKMRPSLALAAQVVLAAAVVFLVADRLAGGLVLTGDGARMTADVSSQKLVTFEEAQRAAAAQGAALQTILEEHKRALTDEVDQRMRTALHAAQTEQKRLHVQIAALEAAKRNLNQEIAAFKARETRQSLQAKASTQKFERRFRDMQNTAEVERARFQDEIKSLTMAKNTMNRDIVALKKRENEHALNQQAVVMARILLPHEIDRKTAEIAEVTVLPGLLGKAAEASGERDTAPFTFWVSFQDGTSEENIERLIRTIEGRKGPVNGGWYNVEVTLPKPQTPEELLETLKREKIVKAVTRSRNANPGETVP